MTAASGGMAGRCRVTDPIVRTKATMPAASRAPRPSPTTRADDPDGQGLGEHEPRHLAAGCAPAARSSPTSRTCSMTVIDSVLKIRNAPANSATAAISAVVAWKSVVELRSEAARSCGVDRTYGCAWSRASSASETVRDGGAGRHADVHPGHSARPRTRPGPSRAGRPRSARTPRRAALRRPGSRSPGM